MIRNWQWLLGAGAAGLLSLVACSPENMPKSPFATQEEAHPQAQIIETADATYMKPVGKPIVKTTSAGGPAGDPVSSDRLTALELRVDSLQKQIDHIMPTITKLQDTDRTPEAMLDNLNGKNKPPVMADKTLEPSGAVAPPPAAVTPAPLEAADTGAPQSLIPATPAVTPKMPPHPHTHMPTPSPSSSALAVKDLRIGEHPGATRIVLDSTGKAPFTTDLDNDEHILTITVPRAAWSGGTVAHLTPKSPLLQSWQAASDGHGGTRFALQLRKPAKIAAKETMNGNPARLVVDLAAE